MTANDLHTLKEECLRLLQYYIDKTSQLMKIYKDSNQMRYFLFALKGNRESIKGEDISKEYLVKCIDALLGVRNNTVANDHLGDLQNELHEELTLLKLRYDLD